MLKFFLFAAVPARCCFRGVHAPVAKLGRHPCLSLGASSVEDAALVGGDHVLNVNECIITAVLLEKLERLNDEVAQVGALALGVVDFVALVPVLGLEEVEHGENLAVVGHEGLADRVGASHERLQNLEADGDDLWVTRVQGSYLKVVTVVI